MEEKLSKNDIIGLMTVIVLALIAGIINKPTVWVGVIALSILDIYIFMVRSALQAGRAERRRRQALELAKRNKWKVLELHRDQYYN